MKKTILLGIATLITLSSCYDIRIKEHPEWKSYFDEYGVTGAFEIYDNNKEIAHYYDKEKTSERIIPASTFKIFNSLVALESAVAKDEQIVIEWDGVEREIKEWNQDLTMSEAFKYSAVPYFQELSRRIGQSTMQFHLDSVQYGNMTIGEELDEFWLNGSLLISPDEQVGFMKRLYHTQIPSFSERSHRIVRGMMFQEEGENFRLYYKTGYDHVSNPNILWVVGFIEQFESRRHVKTRQIEHVPHPHFFALIIESTDPSNDMINKRIDLLWKLLEANGLGDHVSLMK